MRRSKFAKSASGRCKPLLLLWLVLLMSSLVGCGSETVRMDGDEWELTLVQSGADGSVIGCGSAVYELYKEVENLMVVDCTCSAQNGNFTITEQTSHTSYTGTYRVERADGESTVYSIVTASHRGTAVSSMTKYVSASAQTETVPTLLITLGDYVLCFQMT